MLPNKLFNQPYVPSIWTRGDTVFHPHRPTVMLVVQETRDGVCKITAPGGLIRYIAQRSLRKWPRVDPKKGYTR